MTESGSGEMASSGAADPIALVHAVLRESYQRETEDLRACARKVRGYNKRKSAIRDYVNSLEQLRDDILLKAFEIGVDLCTHDERDRAELARIIEETRIQFPRSEVGYELCIPNHVPPQKVNSL